jgi:hypothetical protein
MEDIFLTADITNTLLQRSTFLPERGHMSCHRAQSLLLCVDHATADFRPDCYVVTVFMYFLLHGQTSDLRRARRPRAHLVTLLLSL